MNILVIGSGGREHAMAWKLRQSARCDKLYVAPGNAGTAGIAANLDVSVTDFQKISDLVLELDIQLIIVGPEAPLVEGIVDHFKTRPELKNVSIVGPDKAGAQLEGSKDYAKQFMKENGIPTAASETFTVETLRRGLEFLKTLKAPYVLKADGLAAGKGVIIAQTLEEAQQALREMLENQKFGAASQKVVIEEYLNGIELSVFALIDGENYKILPEAKDYKRIGEGDTGPNTGGMGSVSPVPFANSAFLKKVEDQVVKPTVAGLKKQNIDYRGFLFLGLMNVKGDPYVIEYNVRLGDPEAQVVIPRIKNDFVDLMTATAQGRLSEIAFDLDNRTAATIVMVAGGYPGAYEKGKTIQGLDAVRDSVVFHAGTKAASPEEVVTDGGRVLAVTSLAATMEEALQKSYANAGRIRWDGAYCRRDIGKDLLALKS